MALRPAPPWQPQRPLLRHAEGAIGDGRTILRIIGHRKAGPIPRMPRCKALSRLRR
jgi:hypothetical protein